MSFGFQKKTIIPHETKQNPNVENKIRKNKAKKPARDQHMVVQTDPFFYSMVDE